MYLQTDSNDQPLGGHEGRGRIYRKWSTTECNKAKYNFTVYGGVRNYRYLIYKIDGQLARQSMRARYLSSFLMELLSEITPPMQ